jgi:hypothetical protein
LRIGLATGTRALSHPRRAPSCRLYPCGTAYAAWTECRRIALAAHQDVPTADIIATKPAELALAAVKSLLDSAPAGEERQVRATMAGAHPGPLADAQMRALQVAADRNDRTVYVGQAGRPTLRALARRNYGTLNYQPGLGRRKVIESLTLNDRGIRQVEKASQPEGAVDRKGYVLDLERNPLSRFREKLVPPTFPAPVRVLACFGEPPEKPGQSGSRLR